MDTIFECGLCSLSYDDSQHKPLSLPCGHVFCQDCLAKQMKQLSCPIDKSKFEVSASSLPPCYTILANLPKKSQVEGCCLRHPKKKVKFLCKSHEKFLCTECVVDHTGAGHNIVAFTVNLAVVKSDLKALEGICEASIRECEDKKKETESKARSFKEIFAGQVEKINQSYENCLRNLQVKKKEMTAFLNKNLAEQIKSLEKIKENFSKTQENSWKVLSKVKSLSSALPCYETLSQIVRSLKQELKVLEFPIESSGFQVVVFKNSEPFTLFSASFEEIDLVEAEKRVKVCHSRPALQVNVLNSEVSKTFIAKTEKSGVENKSPEKIERSKCRQNYHARNHPKRMPWRKRTRSY